MRGRFSELLLGFLADVDRRNGRSIQ
jgi:hypothetical protein